MFSPKLNTVFASRWKALWWAASILLTAYCSVPQAGETDDLGFGPSEQPTVAPLHKSPWAK